MMRLLHWATSRRTSESNAVLCFLAEWGAPPPEIEEAGSGLFSILCSRGDDFHKETGPGIEWMKSKAAHFDKLGDP